MTTAIFVFRNKCPACDELKQDHMEEIRSLYAKKDIKIREHYLHDFNFPQFLKIIRFYPTTILMPTQMYENIKSYRLRDIFASMSVLNGKIKRYNRGIGYRISKPRKDYKFLDPKEYIRFYDNYIENGANNDLGESSEEETLLVEVENIALEKPITEKRCKLRTKPIGAK